MRYMLVLVLLLAGCQESAEASDGGGIDGDVDGDVDSDSDTDVDADVDGDSDADADEDLEVLDGDTEEVPDADEAESVDWGACEGNEDCVLVLNGSCCPLRYPAGFGMVDAVHRDHVAAHDAEVCDPPPWGCPEDGPEVHHEPLAEPWVFATCEEGRCVAYSLQEGPGLELAACDSLDGSGCILRYAACCECDVPQTEEYVVSLAEDQVEAYEALVCNGSPCSCSPTYPDVAWCQRGTGHCQVGRP